MTVEPDCDKIKNVLIVSIEDLNDWIGPLGGHPDAHTPNLDAFFAEAGVFQNAFTTVPACSPARTSALFSSDPWDTGILTNSNKWTDLYDPDDSGSIFAELSKNGYSCHLHGKVFRQAFNYPKNEFVSASIPEKDRHKPTSKAVKSGALGRGADFGVDRSGALTFDDMHVADAISKMHADSSRQVWAVGIFRPHLPFIARQEFFDVIPERPSLPPGLQGNSFSHDASNEVKGLPRGAAEFYSQFQNDGKALEEHGEYLDFVRAYLASIAYADHLFGEMINRLKETDLYDTTLIAVWSDHGWQLGEKLAFRKFTPWERSLRIPFAFKSPAIAEKTIDTVAQISDLGPTLIDLLGLPVPERFAGVSHRAELEGVDPSPARTLSTSSWVIKRRTKVLTAVSVRTSAHRFIKYDTGEEELYAHPADRYETNNLLANGASEDVTELRTHADSILTKIALRLSKDACRNAGLSRASGPGLICVGAQNVGADWLAAALRGHPQCWNPGIKELHFFDRQNSGFIPPERLTEFQKNGRIWKNRKKLRIDPRALRKIAQNGFGFHDYLGMFEGRAPGSVGWEISPSYSIMPNHQIRYLAEVLPDCKFVFLVGNPLDRALTGLRRRLEVQARRQGTAFDAGTAAAEWLEKSQHFHSQYRHTIPRWDAALSDRILYVTSSARSRGAALEHISEFLGVDPLEEIEVSKAADTDMPLDVVSAVTKRVAPDWDFLRNRFGSEFGEAL